MAAPKKRDYDHLFKLVVIGDSGTLRRAAFLRRL